MKLFLLKMWRIIRGSLRWTLYIVTGLVSFLYLLGAYSPYIRPSLTTIPAFLGLIFPLLFVLQLMISLYWLVRGRWRILGLMVLIFALSWSALSAYLPINRRWEHEPTETGKQLKILSYNTSAFGFKRHSASSPNPILQYIKSTDADIVCLQESMLADSREYGVTLEQLKAYLGQQYPYIDARNAQSHGSTLILLSKYPIKEAHRFDIESHANGAVWYKLQVEGREVMVVNLHLESFRLRKKDGEGYVELVRNREALRLKEAVNAKFAPTFRAHNIQADMIANQIESYGSDRVIVCGDFNDTPVSYARRRIAHSLQDTYIERGNGFGFSYTTWFFVVRIDHILCGHAFVPESAYVDDAATMSDHHPIHATLWMPEAKQ
ncbi:MAG: endonuclease/exonuclease/phosphatase family protein [Porphyromonadaceae bacterium]|nr:endonuclease/exonuclease/phosphatase family protein [Porphyromonadaceae bacterium]